jgi:DNA-binding NarL/FixJ family response regulator
MHDHSRYIRELLGLGVSGYLLKSAASSDIVSAIHAALRGETYLSPAVASRVVEAYVGMGKSSSEEERYSCLSNREREVFQMLAEGRTTREISGILCVSPSTVKTHRANILEKLGMDNLASLIQYAVHLGIIDVRP